MFNFLLLRISGFLCVPVLLLSLQSTTTEETLCTTGQAEACDVPAGTNTLVNPGLISADDNLTSTEIADQTLGNNSVLAPGTETEGNLVATIDGEIIELETSTSGNLDYVAELTDGSTVKGMLDNNLHVLSLEDDSVLRDVDGLRGATRFYARTNRNNSYDTQNCELKVHELPSGQNIWNLPAVDNQGPSLVFCSMEAIDKHDNYYYTKGQHMLSIDKDGNQRWSSSQRFHPARALVTMTGEAIVQAEFLHYGTPEGFRLSAYRLADGVRTMSGWVFPNLYQSNDATPYQTIFSDGGANLYIGGMGVVNNSCLDLIESGKHKDCVISARITPGSRYGGVQISRLQVPTTAARDGSITGYSLDAVKRFTDAEDPGVADAFYSGGYILMQKDDSVTVLDGMTLSLVKSTDVKGTVAAVASGNVYSTVVEAGRTSIYAYPL